MSDPLESLAAHAVPLTGGHSGETFLVGAAGEQAVLRLYVRNPDRVAVDAALLDLVRGLVPVPRVLDLRTPQMSEGPAYLLTELLPGRLLEEVLPGADGSLRARLARSVAGVLARLNGIPFRRSGELVDASLQVATRSAPADSLAAWAEQHMRDGPLAQWRAAEQRALLRVADHADTLLESTDRWCLAHSDFNAKNLLVDPTGGEVTGLLDWEFAHAGTPYTDLGNLLRHERDPELTEPLLARFRALAPAHRDDLAGLDDLVDRARAADLWALVELASRAGQHAPADRAHDLLRAVASAGDLHAAAATT